MKRPVFNSVTLILSLAVFIYCAKPNMSVASLNTSQDKALHDAPLRYLALGDSYTIGQSVAVTERFPYLTTVLLRQQNIAIADPEYIATTGWTTEDLLTAIHQQENLGTFDVVSLLIGVNDQYQQLDTAGYRARFAQLLEQAIALAGNRLHRVFVLSIPDYSATPFVAPESKARVHTEIESFNAINKEITRGRNITYIDITTLTRAAATDASLLASDGLHYSGKEHQKWAALLARVMAKSLQ
jgi:lysophospholipase L1-like esterase